jgi:thymidine phosphorylase
MLLLGKLVPNLEEGRDEAQQALDSGRAVEVFARMVAALGGPTDFVERADTYLVRAPAVKPVIARRTGFVQGMNARDIGVELIDLGGGRRRTSDVLNLSVGFSDFVQAGTKVSRGDTLALVHAADEASATSAAAVLGRVIHIDDPEPKPRPAVIERIARP